MPVKLYDTPHKVVRWLDELTKKFGQQGVALSPRAAAERMRDELKDSSKVYHAFKLVFDDQDDPYCAPWMLFVLSSMRSLAMDGLLSKDQASGLLQASRAAEGSLGFEETVQTIKAIGVHAATAPVLLAFAEKNLQSENVKARWLALEALRYTASFGTAKPSDTLLATLAVVLTKERDMARKAEYVAVKAKLKALRKSTSAVVGLVGVR